MRGGGGGGGLIQYIIGRFLSRDGSSVSEPLSVGKSSLCENERVVISTSNLSNFMRLVNSFCFRRIILLRRIIHL